MHKGTLITLGGLSFTLEEPAYTKLDKYLEDIRRSFSAYEDKEEIVDDIEARIAEKFTAFLKNGGEVVTEDHVDSVMTDLGTAKEIGEGDAEPEPSTIKDPATVKRLFRDPEHAILGGVCSGLAAYFSVDVVWVRALFLLLLIPGAFGFWAYLIFWIIMPQARTLTDRMQMQGTPVTLESIREAVDSRRGSVANLGQSMGTIAERLARLIVPLTGIVIALVAGAALLGITAGLVALFAGVTSFIGAPFSNFPSTAGEYAAALTVYGLVALPFLLVLLLGFSLVRGKMVMRGMVSLTIVGLWILSLFGTVGLGVQYGPRIQQELDAHTVTRDINVEPFQQVRATGTSRIKVTYGEKTGVHAAGLIEQVDQLRTAVNNGVLTIDWQPKRPYVILNTEPAIVEITMPNLTSIEAENMSRVTVSGFENVDTLKVVIRDTARVTMDGKAKLLDTRLYNMSRLEASAFRADTVRVSAYDVSRATVNSESQVERELHNNARVITTRYAD